MIDGIIASWVSKLCDINYYSNYNNIIYYNSIYTFTW